MKLEVPNPQEVVKEVFWLAWQACGRPVGLGWLQDRTGVTKADVWKNVSSAGDYPVNLHSRPGTAYGDYVFGRMLKLMLAWDETSITYDDHPPHPEYQAWMGKYPTYDSLVRNAIQSLADSQKKLPCQNEPEKTPSSVASPN